MTPSLPSPPPHTNNLLAQHDIGCIVLSIASSHYIENMSCRYTHTLINTTFHPNMDKTTFTIMTMDPYPRDQIQNMRPERYHLWPCIENCTRRVEVIWEKCLCNINKNVKDWFINLATGGNYIHDCLFNSNHSKDQRV